MLAGCLAIPLAYFAIKKWQETYVLQKSFGVTLYVIPTLAIMVIALLCVMAVSVKTAIKNPVDSLRYE